MSLDFKSKKTAEQSVQIWQKIDSIQDTNISYHYQGIYPNNPIDSHCDLEHSHWSGRKLFINEVGMYILFILFFSVLIFSFIHL